jgi:hypothetical protein
VSELKKAGLDIEHYRVEETYFDDKDRLEFPKQLKDMPKEFLEG